jgi:glycosyltransferase involved in cell wall biosynthesis
MSVDGDTRLIRVFVHLSVPYGAKRWQDSFKNGKLIGINDRLPYGYYRAAEDGCQIVYSEDKKENRLDRSFRLWMKSIFGVDIVHAWRNRKGIYDSDIVWTHTELQYIAVLLLFQILFWKSRPKLIAQSVWLYDRWQDLGLLKRWVFSRLIAKADILTVLSPENLKVARTLFPHIRSEFIPFGINVDELAPLKKEKIHHPVRIFSIGNDPHRDWQILIQSVKDLPDCHLKIASWKLNKEVLKDYNNIELLHISTASKLLSAYEWADIILLTIKPNLHASGITVLQEAAVLGIAAICSDIGGLKAYFSDEEIYFIPHGDASEIQKAIATLAADDQLRWRLAARAQARMRPGDLSSRSYARRHAELSRELLAWEPVPAASSDAAGGRPIF